MASSAVNRPTNAAQRDADVSQKLQLYGIYSAFANGKVPSNKQIDVALNSVMASRPLSNPSSKLSPEGRHLVNDLKDVIEQAKVLLLTKNQGNLLQDFIYQTGQISGGNAKVPGAPIDKGTAQQHGNQALEGLRTLGTLIISNGQFRKLLSDASVLLRDVAGDAAQNAANRVNPSEEQLSQIDNPAEDNTWHDVPKVGDLKQQARDQYGKNKPFSRSDVQGVAENQTADQGGAQAGAQSLQNKAMANIPDETQEKVKGNAKRFGNQSKEYAQKKFPQERREQTIYRLKKMIVEIQGHSDYQQAIETLLSLAEQYGGHSKNVTAQGVGSVKGAHDDNSLNSAETDLKTLLERFANNTSSEDLVDSINTIYRDADADPELKGWFRNLDKFVRKCLQEQGYVLKDTSNQEWNQIYDKGNFLLRERYRNHTQRVLDEFTFLGKQFDEDPLNHRFGNSVQKLFQELGNDENGKPTFKKHLIEDVSKVILPGFFESIQYVPVPRIEYSDPMIDAIVENLIIEGDNLAPNSFEFESDNFFRWGRKTVTSYNKNKVMVAVSGIQMDLKDVSYHIKKKQGFPSITDTGIMDIHMGGTGFSFKIAMETADKKDRQNFFKINKVDISMKTLTIKLKQSKHKLIFNIFKPLLFAVVKPAIAKVLEKLIKDQVHNLDGKAYQIYREAERATEVAKRNPEEAQNIYQRYVHAAQNVMTNKKQQAAEKSADKKTNIAMNQQESIFPDIKLPGGISTQATKYKELAAKGDKWESPIFGIGSAAETSNLPSVGQITRKNHNTAPSQVKGSQNLDHGNSSSGFSNQVDNAFGMEKGANGGVTSGSGMGPGSGYDSGMSSGVGQSAGQGYGQGVGSGVGSGTNSGVNSGLNSATHGGTTLGSHNPVLTGGA